ncbi:MAG: site-2 protease family protein [Parcubacteria group bacterium]|nr:site-2 protease family protein [Parcubacteria group bacterium]
MRARIDFIRFFRFLSLTGLFGFWPFERGLLGPLVNGELVTLLLFVVIFLTAITLHEFAHAWTATMLGDPTPAYEKRLTVNPLAHLDPIGTLLLFLVGFGWGKPVPFNPYQLRNQRYGPALVAVAGPATNLVIAIIFALTIRLLGPSFLAPSVLAFFLSVIVLNIALAVFNLIPIPPLDGSKVLFAFLPDSLTDVKLSLERYGPFILIFFVFVLRADIVSPLVVTVISLFGRIFGLQSLV